MATDNKLGSTRLLDPANAALSGQSRVNAEIFSAVEIIARKLERSEAERDRLARRLALIESAATVDEKTGKLYLPVVTNQSSDVSAASTSKWVVSASLMSSAIALFALGLVLFREPPAVLTKEQLATLNALQNSQFAAVTPDSKGWKNPETEEPNSVASNTVTSAPATPDSTSSQISSAAPAPQPSGDAASQISPAAGSPVVEPVPASADSQMPDTSALSKTTSVPATTPPKLAEIPAVTTPSTTPPELPKAVVEKAPDNKAVKEDKPVKEAAKKPAAAAPAETASSADSANIQTPDPDLPGKLAQLEKRAIQGIPEAQHDLGTLYASGKLVAQNYHRAIYWFNKSAEGGVANAHYNLGVIYQQGLGVPADMQKALASYEKAAELGHPEAMYNLGIAYIEGIGTKADIDKGVSYFKRAAKAGVVQAAYNLGVLYESNFIGPIDTGKALEWYQMAANGGHAEARDAVTRLKGVAAASGDQALTLADMVEPAAGEESGEGDASPATENKPSVQRALITSLQQEFIKQGLLPGHADGMMSPQTEDAIRAYQKKLGWVANGIPTQALLDKVKQASAQ